MVKSESLLWVEPSSGLEDPEVPAVSGSWRTPRGPLRLQAHQAVPPPDWRGAFGCSPPSSSSSLAGCQVFVLTHQDVVVPVLTLGAQGRPRLHTRDGKVCVFVLFL
ncbi:hypothetical protein CesoFtcFv8_020109 [Champsocephalus esox]|uniref:Uncharacterized protein n=1 Tax=Champsocephalus esox TaxID=159716 RepID=A0AAN8BFG0_9TELE|nr:hypothetical protein CesoFtcFv8_020109 [Champsocephalus esox]